MSNRKRLWKRGKSTRYWVKSLAWSFCARLASTSRKKGIFANEAFETNVLFKGETGPSVRGGLLGCAYAHQMNQSPFERMMESREPARDPVFSSARRTKVHRIDAQLRKDEELRDGQKPLPSDSTPSLLTRKGVQEVCCTLGLTFLPQTISLHAARDPSQGLLAKLTSHRGQLITPSS